MGCDNSYTQKIYEPLDEGALHIISLEEQDEEGYNTFYRATILAKAQYVKEKKMTQEELMKLDSIYVSWQELINLLRQDFRYKK